MFKRILLFTLLTIVLFVINSQATVQSQTTPPNPKMIDDFSNTERTELFFRPSTQGGTQPNVQGELQLNGEVTAGGYFIGRSIVFRMNTALQNGEEAGIQIPPYQPQPPYQLPPQMVVKVSSNKNYTISIQYGPALAGGAPVPSNLSGYQNVQINGTNSGQEMEWSIILFKPDPNGGQMQLQPQAASQSWITNATQVNISLQGFSPTDLQQVTYIWISVTPKNVGSGATNFTINDFRLTP